MEGFHIKVDGGGVALVTWDMPGRSMNVVNAQSTADFEELVGRLKRDDTIKGAVITSGKAAFCAGGDLVELAEVMAEARDIKPGTPEMEAFFRKCHHFNQIMRALETCGKPVAAAINGLALGGGLEVTLACHHRVVADDPRLRLGLPECTIGLLPGGGGTQRLPRLIGAQKALPLLMEGKTLSTEQAREIGIVDQVVPAEEVVATAIRWVRENPGATQPWDKRGFKVPGADPFDPATSGWFMAANAQLGKTTYGNYPSQSYILSCVYEGSSLAMDMALATESRYFTKLLCQPEAQGMVRTLFFSRQALSKSARRPKGVATWKAGKVGVLGAGLMGAGIACSAAQAGLDVILLDTSQANAQKGKAYTEKVVARAVKGGDMTQEKAEAILARIQPTASYNDLAGSDLIIEAVFEDREIKAEVIRAAGSHLAPGGILASNTSTLPITGLAENSAAPQQFIGMHFFSPVERMELVELIVGKQTSEETLAKAMDLVAQIRKTPIIVNDSRGFYTSRVFATYVNEGMTMLAEGVDPVEIENAGKQSGMPMPPLALSDAVGLDLGVRVRQQTEKDLGANYVAGPDKTVLETMVLKHGRSGRGMGKGFYDYPTDKQGKKALWPGLADLFKRADPQPEFVDLKDRLLFIQALEAVRCYADGVISDVRDMDVGAILGWNFARYTGGPVSFIDGMGAYRFVGRCDELADKYGERFRVPPLLRDMAQGGKRFYAG